jgi:hypothetical protein
MRAAVGPMEGGGGAPAVGGPSLLALLAAAALSFPPPLEVPGPSFCMCTGWFLYTRDVPPTPVNN